MSEEQKKEGRVSEEIIYLKWPVRLSIAFRYGAWKNWFTSHGVEACAPYYVQVYHLGPLKLIFGESQGARLYELFNKGIVVGTSFSDEYSRNFVREEAMKKLVPENLKTGAEYMGTRADFYIGRGESARWLGSIAWDGYPEAVNSSLLSANAYDEFLKRLEVFVGGRDDWTPPEDGWPWPWDDSGTTDYAYAYDDGKVWASCFGSPWFDPNLEQPEDDSGEKVQFPKMKTDQAAKAGSARSGIMVFSVKQPTEEAK